jgi:hypothetical protein
VRPYYTAARRLIRQPKHKKKKHTRSNYKGKSNILLSSLCYLVRIEQESK